MNDKARFLLKLFAGSFFILAARIVYLAIIVHDEKVLEAQKPQRRVVVLKADRGSIVDRFGIPLAENKICYRACVCYSDLAQIPSMGWATDSLGKRTRTYPRKSYIRRLAELLHEELGLDASRIEDLIYAKAAWLPHAPFALQSHLSEAQYYRLKALEREWPGLYTERKGERFYPLGKTASHILGYLGPIAQTEWRAIAGELEELRQRIGIGEVAALDRYRELSEKAYTLDDWIGKAGIEKQFEERLRGNVGVKTFEVDRKGNCLRELPESRSPVVGETIQLSISSELQQFCESLLLESEKMRKSKQQKLPWIKGGAIVVMDPNHGEILAMAAIPRFDPNDFLGERSATQVAKWQESEMYLASLWDGLAKLQREDTLHSETWLSVDWPFFLQTVLPLKGPSLLFWQQVGDVHAAVELQEDFEAILYHAGNIDPSDLVCRLFAKEPSVEILTLRKAVEPQWKRLEQMLSSIEDPRDKLFLIDLCRMAVYSPAFTDALLQKMGNTSLQEHRLLSQRFLRLHTLARKRIKQVFRETLFQEWRQQEGAAFLKRKRLEERAMKSYARPYIDYFDREEQAQFEHFWQQQGFALLAAELKGILHSEFLGDLVLLEDWEQLKQASHDLTLEECVQWFKTMRPFRELSRPLLGRYRALRGKMGEQREKDLAAAFYPKTYFGFTRSHAFQGTSPPGSVFKLITAYEALRQKNPLTFQLRDEVRLDGEKKLIVARTMKGDPFYRHYKGGRLPKSASSHIGVVDLLGALEQSSNPYFSILAGDVLADPEDLSVAAKLFGLGSLTGIELPGEGRGFVPTDLRTNRTGLYSAAIGQHTLLATPLQMASALVPLANGGRWLVPQMIKGAIAEEKPVPLPNMIRNKLLEGMDRVVWGEKGGARAMVIRQLWSNPEMMRDYLALQHQMIGKTGTAEITVCSDMNPSAAAVMYKNVWFGSIAFTEDKKPELVVMVCLRFGEGGKEAAPLAAQVIHQWRKIQAKHGCIEKSSRESLKKARFE